jgi:putative ABC transport system permease protein
MWQQHFAGSADAIGKRVKVNGVDVTIVGVSPPRFRGTTYASSKRLNLWLPLTARPVLERTGWAVFTSHDSTKLSVIARLQPKVSQHSAAASVQTIALRNEQARTRKGQFGAPSAEIVPVLADNYQPRPQYERLVESAVLGGITLLILLVTCTNVSALLVGLAVARRREIAVRLSLGAARTRLIRQLLTESVMIATIAGALTSLLVWFLFNRFSTLAPDLQLAFEWPAIAFTFAIAAGTGILFGISPALHATRLGVSDVLKDSAAAVSATRSWMQRGLVVMQVALTQPLLVGLAALLLIMTAQMRGRPDDSVYDHVVAIDFNVLAGNVRTAGAAEALLAMRERLAAVPGVVDAVPQRSGYSVWQVTVHPSDRVPGFTERETFRARTHWAPAGYFDLLEIPVLRGREFIAAERHPDSRAIVISTDLAAKLWGPADPIGRRLLRDTAVFTVVGVVDEGQAGRSEDGNTVRIFVPVARFGESILVRTRLPAEAMIPTLRAVASAHQPPMPITSMRTLAAIEAETRAFMLRVNGVAAAGGLLALLLSAISLYAVVAFAVRQRTREIGIRTALGANRTQVVRMFFLRGVQLSVVGMFIGLPLSLIGLRIIGTEVGLPESGMPMVAALIATSVITVAALATWIPARRAAGVDPLTALRHE